jgi:hypothetical protein
MAVLGITSERQSGERRFNFLLQRERPFGCSIWLSGLACGPFCRTLLLLIGSGTLQPQDAVSTFREASSIIGTVYIRVR